MAKGGFVIHYQDGSVFTEGIDGYWDDAPDKGIIELQYVLGDKVEVVKDCDFYFFSNEAIHGPSLSGKPGIWMAGIIGGVKDGGAIYKRVVEDGTVETTFLPAEELRFTAKTYRRAQNATAI